MKTTLIIPDQLMRQLERRAAQSRRTLSAVVAESAAPRAHRHSRRRETDDVLVAAPRAAILTETERHREVLGEVTALHPRLAGNVVHDLHTAVLMKEHGMQEIRTADADFHQFGFLRVVNPLV